MKLLQAIAIVIGAATAVKVNVFAERDKTEREIEHLAEAIAKTIEKRAHDKKVDQQVGKMMEEFQELSLDTLKVLGDLLDVKTKQSAADRTADMKQENCHCWANG